MGERAARKQAKSYANSFDWRHTVTVRSPDRPEQWFRYGNLSDQDSKGSFFTKEFMTDSELVRARLALPERNLATGRQVVRIEGPTEVFEGVIANGTPPGARQAMVLDWANVKFEGMKPVSGP